MQHDVWTNIHALHYMHFPTKSEKQEQKCAFCTLSGKTENNKKTKNVTPKENGVHTCILALIARWHALVSHYIESFYIHLQLSGKLFRMDKIMQKTKILKI